VSNKLLAEERKKERRRRIIITRIAIAKQKGGFEKIDFFHETS
jgi:hypothetical protein